MAMQHVGSLAGRIPRLITQFMTGLARGSRESQLRTTLERLGIVEVTDQDIAEILPLNSDIVMACVQWFMRTFPQSRIVLEQETERGRKRVVDHPLVRVLRRPNNIYTMTSLLQGTVLDWTTGGNAYWHLLRDMMGRCIGIEYVPAWSIWPYTKYGTTDFISGYYFYGYNVATGEYSEGLIPPKDIIHFRFGLDPMDNRLGLSPLKTVLREIFTDKEAGRWTATLLYNNCVPGMLMAPKFQEQSSSVEELRTARDYVTNTFGGRGRGRPWVLQNPLDVHQFGFSPEQLSLETIRKVPENRIAACLGLSTTTVGFSSGQDSNTYNNSREMRAAAYESAVMPLNVAMADVLNHKLIPEFFGYVRGHELAFDTSMVKAIEEDKNLVSRRIDRGSGGAGMIMRSTGTADALGLPATEKDDVFMVPSNSVLVKPDGTLFFDPKAMSGPDNPEDTETKRQDNRQDTRQNNPAMDSGDSQRDR